MGKRKAVFSETITVPRLPVLINAFSPNGSPTTLSPQISVFYGPAGVGKSRLICALLEKASKDGWDTFLILTEAARLHTAEYAPRVPCVFASEANAVKQAIADFLGTAKRAVLGIDSLSELYCDDAQYATHQRAITLVLNAIYKVVLERSLACYIFASAQVRASGNPYVQYRAGLADSVKHLVHVVYFMQRQRMAKEGEDKVIITPKEWVVNGELSRHPVEMTMLIENIAFPTEIELCTIRRVQL